ncbi:MAG TPA: response regulator transcription factor [Anaerolineales bacterium]|jgi:DNA-binding NarL/FixJ family response regulator|nr:response regulator transcription factor [Anaerolineales bacterium]
MSAEPIRVLIADDHPIVRQGLEIVINSQTDMKLVGQAINGEEALTLVRELKPDVIVMDLKMPVKNGLVAIQELKKSDPGLPILVLTSFSDEEMVISAIQLGANGVMLKDSAPEQLINSIRDVVHGKSALHPSVAHELMVKFQQSAAATPVDDSLTNREIDVLKCLAQGYSNQKIASALSISTRTVTTHVRNILDKLGLENRTEAGIYAINHKIAP